MLHFLSTDGPIFPPDDDPCSDFVPLPDFGHLSDERGFDGGDFGCFDTDDEFHTDSSEMVPNDAPFYVNQEEDPDIAEIIFQEKLGIQ